MNSNFAVNVPISSVSFGQCGVNILYELYKKGLAPSIFPIGQPDLSSHQVEPEFVSWLNAGIQKGQISHSRKHPSFRLWHLENSLESVSEKQVLLTFYELDNPTPLELNSIRNQSKVLVTSEYTKRTMEDFGATNVEFAPLGFDSRTFKVTNKKYFSDGRIVFNVAGKAEKRKHTEKVIKTWIKKYANSPKHFLQAAVYNPFHSPEENENIVRNILGGRSFFNVSFLGFMQQNSLYADFLNSGDIILSMSGAEGLGLPEMQSVALGKHAVVMDAHGYKTWATPENAVLVKPNSRVPAYDGRFFVEGRPTNQGSIYDFGEDDFLAGCEEAIQRVQKNRINEEGLKLQEKFTWSKTVDQILKTLESI